MEFRLTVNEASRMFEAWRRELEATPGLRAVEGGQIRLDSIPSPAHPVRGVRTEHAMDGSLVIVWYVAHLAATERAIREAATATGMMRLPRHLYTGRLIDILRAADGSVYFKVRTVERIDEATHQPAYRSFSPSKAQLAEMILNPSAASVAASMATAMTPERTEPVVRAIQAPAIVAAQAVGSNGHGVPNPTA
jgi:hypothetical protein